MTIVYKDIDGSIICEDCRNFNIAQGIEMILPPVILEDIGCGCPECVPMFCDSCSEPLRVVKN